MIDISLKNITKSFQTGDDVLNGVTFSVNEGEKVAILGPNGCGKTTLFKIITGELFPDDGSVSVANGKRIGLISQIPYYPEDWTVDDVLKSGSRELQNISNRMKEIEKDFTEGLFKEYDLLLARFESLGGYEVDTMINKVANGLDIFDLRPRYFNVLSGGEQTRVNLARLIIENTDILLLDEPTNHLDLNATIWLENYISSFKGTVLIISHDRFFLDKVVDRCIEISNGIAEFYSGNYSFFKEERQRRFDEKLRKYEKDSAKIEQLTKAAEQMHLWAFMGMDKLHKRAFSMEKRIEKLKCSEKPTESKKLNIKFKEADFSGDEVLDILSLSKGFGSRKLFSDISLEIVGGESIAIIGNNGTGKTTFLETLMGITEPDTGRIRIAPQVKAAYLPQKVMFENEGRSCYETMLYEANVLPQEAYDRLAAFGFRGDDVNTPVGVLSGGERSRLKLCIIMGSDINLLILDEPTNHLDIASREWIESSLLDYDKTLLFVSHDRYLIDKFATRLLVFNDDGTVFDYRGTYKEYQAYLQMIPAYEKTKKDVAESKTAIRPSKPKKSSNGILKLEKDIQKREDKIAELEKQEELFSTDYEKLIEIENQIGEEKLILEELYLKWEAASEL